MQTRNRRINPVFYLWLACGVNAMATAETQTAEYPELLISPPGRWSALKLGELWHHRELIYFLTKRELQVRYKQSFFGVSWAVLQPLVFALVFAFFFGVVAKLKPPEGLPYLVFVVTGIVPWLFVAQAIQDAARPVSSSTPT